MAATLTPAVRASRPSWNPLRCGGTGLPPNLLIMAKAVAIALLLTNHVRLLPTPFLPFLPWLDAVPPLLFQRSIQVLLVASAAALLLNRRVRVSAFLLGLSLLAGVVASKAYYGNNKTFCGLILVLAGLHQPGRSPWMLRAQLVIVYFGAGLNKLLDADWRTGVFFHNWAANRLHQPVFLALEPLLPPLLLAKAMSWFTIVTELGLSAAFLVRRAYPVGIWFSLLLHSGMLLFTGSTFTLFFYGMSAATLAFVEWPAAPLTVIYDGDCGFCESTRRWFERIDLEGMFRWLPYQSGAGTAHGITREMAQQRVHLAIGGKVYSGFRAFRQMLLYNPAAYLVVYTMLAAPGAGDSKFRNVTVAALLVVFSPFFTPAGEASYAVLARNRHRLSRNSRCQVG